MKIVCVVSARSNCVEIAPTLEAFETLDCAQTLFVHTNRRYDYNASDGVLRETTIVWSVHLGARGNMRRFSLDKRFDKEANHLVIEPLKRFGFLKFYANTTCILSYSCGPQEKTAALTILYVAIRDVLKRPLVNKTETSLIAAISTKGVVSPRRGVVREDFGERFRSRILERTRLWTPRPGYVATTTTRSARVRQRKSVR